MEENQPVTESVITKANTTVLFAVLAINIALLGAGIYNAASNIAAVANVSLFEGVKAASGTWVHMIGVCALILIGFLHIANKMLSEKLPFISSLASLVLKVPVNAVLLILALWMAWIGYGKYSVGLQGAGMDIMGGGYILDWVTAVALVYLVFAVKKI